MRAEMYSLPVSSGNLLSIMPRPRGEDWLEDDIASLAAGGVNVLVSLLTPPEAWQLGLMR